MFCRLCKESCMEPWINWKHVGNQTWWCCPVLCRKLAMATAINLTLIRISVKAGASEAFFFASAGRRWEGCRRSWKHPHCSGEWAENRTEGDMRVLCLGSDAFRACTQIVPNNNTIDAEIPLSSGLQCDNSPPLVTCGPSLWSPWEESS